MLKVNETYKDIKLYIYFFLKKNKKHNIFFHRRAVTDDFDVEINDHLLRHRPRRTDNHFVDITVHKVCV